MFTINLFFGIIFFIVYLVLISRQSDKYNWLLSEAYKVSKYYKNEQSKLKKLKELNSHYKAFKKRAFRSLHIIFLISLLIYLLSALAETLVSIAILIPLINYGFFLLSLYIIFNVLKGRGTVDIRRDMDRQFPAPPF